MFSKSFSILVIALVACMALMHQTEAHVGLSRPCARGSPAQGCPAPSNGQSIDYNLNSPIGTFDSKDSPLCKSTVPSQKRTVYNAGQSISTSYSIGASHGGGHCQWALSYDNGKTWAVLKTVLRDCLKGTSSGGSYSVSVPIPAGAPSGKATFMWLWNNAVGNRELYSNCADIEIKGTAGGKITGLVPLIANYGSGSFYIPEFPLASQDAKEGEFKNRKSITIQA
ncbi:hypothetical protein BG004_000575 [Podila humilis]|nr:hypothetical protein BG004_000575 [Podila humilis]